MQHHMFVFVIAAKLAKHHCAEKAKTYKCFPASGVRASKQYYFLHLPSENIKLFSGNITSSGRGISNTYKTSVSPEWCGPVQLSGIPLGGTTGRRYSTAVGPQHL